MYGFGVELLNLSPVSCTSANPSTRSRSASSSTWAAVWTSSRYRCALPIKRGVVARLAERPHVRRRVRRDLGPVRVDAVVAHVALGHERRPRRHAQRPLTRHPREPHAFGCEPVERRREHPGVAGTAHHVGTVLVGHHQHDVRHACCHVRSSEGWTEATTGKRSVWRTTTTRETSCSSCCASVASGGSWRSLSRGSRGTAVATAPRVKPSPRRRPKISTRRPPRSAGACCTPTREGVAALTRRPGPEPARQPSARRAPGRARRLEPATQPSARRAPGRARRLEGPWRARSEPRSLIPYWRGQEASERRRPGIALAVVEPTRATLIVAFAAQSTPSARCARFSNWSVVISPDVRATTWPVLSTATKYGYPGRPNAFAASEFDESARIGAGQC